MPLPPVSLWHLQQLSGRPGSSSSFNGLQDGAELLKQRRRLDMEVLSQRTRAVAAERALAEAVQENKALQQHVRTLKVRVVGRSDVPVKCLTTKPCSRLVGRALRGVPVSVLQAVLHGPMQAVLTSFCLRLLHPDRHQQRCLSSLVCRLPEKSRRLMCAAGSCVQLAVQGCGMITPHLT